MLSRWRTILLVSGQCALFFLAVFFTYFNFQGKSDYLPAGSLKQLAALNNAYGFSAEYFSNEKPLAQGDMLADVLGAPGQNQSNNKGIIVSLDDSVASDAFILLQPSVQLSDEQLQNVADNYVKLIPEIDSAELDQPLDLSSANATVPAISAGGKNIVKSVNAKTVKVAVLDTGIDSSHEIFNKVQIGAGWNVIDDTKDVDDDVGHGTHVSGIIASNSANITIVPYKVASLTDGRLSHVLKALNKAMGEDVDIINLSFGFESDSKALRKVLSAIEQRGIIVVAASGNKGSSAQYYPASYSDVISVASVDGLNHKLSKSDYGDWVDVAAYGYRVRSAIPNNLYARMSGTSQATAFVTAKLVEYARKKEGDAMDFLKKDGKIIDGGLLDGKLLVR